MKLDLRTVMAAEEKTVSSEGNYNGLIAMAVARELVEITTRKTESKIVRKARSIFKTLISNPDFKEMGDLTSGKLKRLYESILLSTPIERLSRFEFEMARGKPKKPKPNKTMAKLLISLTSSVRSGSPETTVKKHLKPVSPMVKKFTLDTIKLGGTYQ